MIAYMKLCNNFDFVAQTVAGNIGRTWVEVLDLIAKWLRCC